jgi:hypothetical protein
MVKARRGRRCVCIVSSSVSSGISSAVSAGACRVSPSLIDLGIGLSENVLSGIYIVGISACVDGLAVIQQVVRGIDIYGASVRPDQGLSVIQQMVIGLILFAVYIDVFSAAQKLVVFVYFMPVSLFVADGLAVIRRCLYSLYLAMVFLLFSGEWQLQMLRCMITSI